MVPAVAIGRQFAVDVSPFEVDGGDVPVEDIQIQVVDLNGPTGQAGSELAQVGMEPVEGPAQAVVVSLLGGDAQHFG